MQIQEFFKKFFASVDSLNVLAVSESFTENGTFQFGNNPTVTGRAAIKEFVSGFFSAIGGISHDIRGCWTVGDRAFCEGLVTYVRKDRSNLTVPWAIVSRFEQGKLAEYKTYVDASKLFTP